MPKIAAFLLALTATVTATGCIIRSGEGASTPRRASSPEAVSPREREAARDRDPDRPSDRERDRDRDDPRASTRVVTPRGTVPERGATSRGNWEAAPQQWRKIGEVIVDREGRVSFRLRAEAGPLRAVRFTLQSRSADLDDIEVVFSDGTTYAPGRRLKLREGAPGAVLDLPGQARTVRHVAVRTTDLDGRGRGRLELWGL